MTDVSAAHKQLISAIEACAAAAEVAATNRLDSNTGYVFTPDSSEGYASAAKQLAEAWTMLNPGP